MREALFWAGLLAAVFAVAVLAGLCVGALL